MTDIFAFAVGITSTNGSGTVLDCFFPNPILTPQAGVLSAISNLPQGTSALTLEQAQSLNSASGVEIVPASLLDMDQPLISVRLDSDAPSNSIEEVYLKLHLLSHRLCLPNTLNLDGIFGHLPNLAWTSAEIGRAHV